MGKPCQCQQEAEESHCHCSVVATADLQQNLPIVPRSVSLVAETRVKVKGGKATRRPKCPRGEAGLSSLARTSYIL